MSGASAEEGAATDEQAAEPDNWQPAYPDTSEPVESDQAAEEPEPRHPESASGPEQGWPAGQVLIGVASALLVGGYGLVQWLGAVGLAVAGGAVALGGGGYGYYRWRQRRPRKDRTATPSTTDRSPRRDRARWTASRSPVRSGGRGDRPGRGLVSGGIGGPRRGGLLRGVAGGPARRVLPSRRAGRPAPAARHGAVSASRPRQAINAAGRMVKAAASRLNQTTGGRLSRAVARGRERNQQLQQLASDTARSVARRINAWTGGRLGRAWKKVKASRRIRSAVAWIRQKDAELTGGVGAAVGAWWRRRRSTAAETSEPAAPAAAAAGSPSPDQHIPSPSTGRRRATLIRSTPMSTNPLVSVAADLPAAAAQYHSDDMMDVAVHLDGLHEVPYQAATGIRIWAERLMAEYPMDQRVIDALQDIHNAISIVGAQCDEAAVLFRKVHAGDIARRETPRTGEKKWNA